MPLVGKSGLTRQKSLHKLIPSDALSRYNADTEPVSDNVSPLLPTS